MFIYNGPKSVEEIKTAIKKILDAHNSIMENKEYPRTMENTFREIHVADAADKEELDGWAEYYTHEVAQLKVGKSIIICGAGDNDIPYPMFDYIQSIGNVNRLHLG